ncbi:hypothetical protein R5R35_011329 [Gryllus longicercus]|uniref:Uncharacterized protein n=1 Tax=Gryllus longicercus TaxID=2509291 RepID=A0AAN9ZH78_9ORTH
MGEYFDELSTSDSEKILSKAGLSLIGITGGLAMALVIGCGPFISPALRRVCLPYIPATDTQVQNILKVLSQRKGRLLDIGSGDGRVVIAAAKNGFIADGVELNPWLVAFSKWQALRHGVQPKTNFFYCDLWKFNVSPYNNVIIFGVEEMMSELEEKLFQELDNGAAVIACRFPLPSKTPVFTCGMGIDTIWLYEIKKDSY